MITERAPRPPPPAPSVGLGVNFGSDEVTPTFEAYVTCRDVTEG